MFFNAVACTVTPLLSYMHPPIFWASLIAEIQARNHLFGLSATP